MWDPTLYGRYADHRSRPFYELIARIDTADPASVYDLGCGPGELTAALADRWPQARVVGVDNDPAMLERAESHASARLRFQTGDLSSFLQVDTWETTYNQVLAGPDAVLQWVQGTTLRPALARLDEPGRHELLEVLRPMLRDAYPAGEAGTVFPFRRVFAVRHRPARSGSVGSWRRS